MILKDIAEPISGHQAEILRELADHGTATSERLIDQLYGGDPDGGPNNAMAVLRGHIYHVRKKLKPGWRIIWADHNGLQTVSDGGYAYRLVRQ